MRRLACLVSFYLAMLTAAPAAAAASQHSGAAGCRVDNLTTKQAPGKVRAGSLQAAIDAARTGDTLSIVGRCVGNFTTRTSLTLQGRATKKEPTPTLDGNLCGSVLTIIDANVTVSGLHVVNGFHDCGSTPRGGGIVNDHGDVMIVNSVLTNNRSGGLQNIEGRATLVDSSVIENFAFTAGGGIFTSGSLSLERTTVEHNSALMGGGIYGSGFISLSDSTVVDNHADSAGAGIDAAGDLVLTDTTVSGNSTSGTGGGILSGGTLVLAGTTDVHDNEALHAGGIAAPNGGVTTSAWTGSVNGNTPDDCEPVLVLAGTVCD